MCFKSSKQIQKENKIADLKRTISVQEYFLREKQEHSVFKLFDELDQSVKDVYEDIKTKKEPVELVVVGYTYDHGLKGKMTSVVPANFAGVTESVIKEWISCEQKAFQVTIDSYKTYELDSDSLSLIPSSLFLFYTFGGAKYKKYEGIFTEYRIQTHIIQKRIQELEEMKRELEELLKEV